MMFISAAGAANDSTTPNMNPTFEKYAYLAATEARQRPDSIAAKRCSRLRIKGF